jgi:hypothetical protein
MVLSSDHITGATGKSPTVTISKNGGAFAAPSGTVSEIGQGLYALAANALDANTLGPLLLHATAASCDPRDDTFDVVNYNPTSVVPMSNPPTPGAVTMREICTDALLDIGAISAGEAMGPDLAEYVIGMANRLLDKWNAERAAVYAVSFLPFTFTPTLNPHTLGPSGATWTLAQRPVTLDGLIINLGNGVNAPSVNLDHDAAWYQNLSTPLLTTSYPTDGYYDPTWPNGSLYLWPVPSTAYAVQVLVRTVLSHVSLLSVFDLPPGYREALTLTLEEMLCSTRAFGPMMDGLPGRAASARAVVWANNSSAPPLATQDAGMPSNVGPNRSNFNYLTGFPL